MSYTLLLLAGACASSIVWCVGLIAFTRHYNQLFLEYGNRKYQQGYDHGRKSATLYPHAK